MLLTPPFGGGTKIKVEGVQRTRALIEGLLGLGIKNKNEGNNCVKMRLHYGPVRGGPKFEVDGPKAFRFGPNGDQRF